MGRVGELGVTFGKASVGGMWIQLGGHDDSSLGTTCGSTVDGKVSMTRCY